MKIGEILATGVVTIGLATALFLPGRQTAGVAKAGGNAISKVFGTAISGKSAA